MKIEYVSERASSYGMPGISIDGNDVLAVYQVVKAAVQRARTGEGPSLIDNMTYRWRGHSKSDRNLYRTQEEINQWMERCPIQRFQRLLVSSKLFTQEEVQAIEQRACQTIDQAAEVAAQMPEPSPEHMEDEVFAP
jgi:acetoin:2,6-dichlorophenolindophenol oxidoreductase subunit alpha